jgi:hypothetical protein
LLSKLLFELDVDGPSATVGFVCNGFVVDSFKYIIVAMEGRLVSAECRIVDRELFLRMSVVSIPFPFPLSFERDLLFFVTEDMA